MEYLNNLLPASLETTRDDPEQARFIHIFLARYVSQDRPLTGYFIVCCVMEIIWTVLAQTLSQPVNYDVDEKVIQDEEAEAANKVWRRLMHIPVANIDIPESARITLQKVSGYAIRCYSDILIQIESMDGEPSFDTYAWETMSESLVCDKRDFPHRYSYTPCQKLASICSIALQDMDVDLLTKLKQLLSDESPVVDHLVQEAALRSTSVLVQKYVSL